MKLSRPANDEFSSFGATSRHWPPQAEPPDHGPVFKQPYAAARFGPKVCWNEVLCLLVSISRNATFSSNVLGIICVLVFATHEECAVQFVGFLNRLGQITTCSHIAFAESSFSQ